MIIRQNKQIKLKQDKFLMQNDFLEADFDFVPPVVPACNNFERSPLTNHDSFISIAHPTTSAEKKT
jgi:hypothetical protein